MNDLVNKTDLYPPTESEIKELGIKDYSESLINIAKQLRILDRSLPLNRIEEATTALKSLRTSTTDLRMFLLLRGFDV